MFKPQAIYYEKDIENFTLGKELMEKYKDTPKFFHCDLMAINHLPYQIL